MEAWVPVVIGLLFIVLLGLAVSGCMTDCDPEGTE